DTLEIVWPDGKYQMLNHVKVNQVLRVDYRSATQRPTAPDQPVENTLFAEIPEDAGIRYVHEENTFVDFKMQPVLPHMHSRNGPGITVGDVNGDGLEDFYVGGAAGSSGGMFLQNREGKFERKNNDQLDTLSEQMGVLFFDADNDGDLDLYTASGSTEFRRQTEFYRDHLYLNDGHGEFQPAPHALPDMLVSKSCVTAADYDRDGDLDLFVGGRISPGEYPMPVRSYVLRNDSGGGEVRFTDTNENILPGAQKLGLVCAALWTDYDSDGWIDLLLTGEFLPLQFYHNENGKLIKDTGSNGLDESSGWWNSLASGDFDHDGDTDYTAGNLGLNNHYKATHDEPLCIYASDYNKDGRIDPVMSYYVQGKNYLGHPRDILIDQINSMRARFRTYTDYANATFEESFLPEELAQAYVVCAERFENSYIENLGNGKFRISALPLRAQFSPVYGMISGDYDGDGNLDLLLTGNSYSPEVISGRDDACIGLLLRGDGRGGFNPMSPLQSGFVADNDAKGM
ncbi:MAG TPA: FG-GAP-like repeat-containing protein, partial [Chryseosolibacter sp.]